MVFREGCIAFLKYNLQPVYEMFYNLSSFGA